jgi:hypothetical protein
LDGDDFGVLGKDVFRHPALRMVEFYVFNFGGLDGSSCANRDIDQCNALVLSDETPPSWVSSYSFAPMPAPGSRPGLRCRFRLSGASRHMAQALLGELHA